MLLAPSFSSKSVLIQSLILDIYRGCYQRIYIWSPTIRLDSVWNPVKEYIAKKYVQVIRKIYFEDYNPEELKEVIERQRRVIQYEKDKGQTNLFSILIVLDDLSENREFL